MNKYPLLVALLLFTFPAFAGEVNSPKPGHYEGTATIHGGGVTRKFSFNYSPGPITFINPIAFIGPSVKNIHITPNHFHEHSEWRISANYKFHFKITDVAGIVFTGHGIWEKNNFVAGDFREHPAGGDSNIYYTWHAHWVHL